MTTPPLFGPFVRPTGIIFPQHADVLVVQVSEQINAADITAGITSVPAITAVSLGSPFTPASLQASQKITQATAAGMNSASDQSPTDIALSIGGAVTAEGVQFLTGAMVTNLAAWTTGPARQNGVTNTDIVVRGYIFFNLSLLAKKYGVAGSSGKAFICNIDFSGGTRSNYAVWAEAIPHCRHVAFGSPNSLSGKGGTTMTIADSMGWSDGHQAVKGWCKGVGTPPGSGTSTAITPSVAVNAYLAGSFYTCSMTGSNFGVNTFSTTSGSGDD